VIEQTIWLPPRGTRLTEVCEACEEEHPGPPATVTATLLPGEASGWATCERGHVLRVHRMGCGMPAGALH